MPAPKLIVRAAPPKSATVPAPVMLSVPLETSFPLASNCVCPLVPILSRPGAALALPMLAFVSVTVDVPLPVPVTVTVTVPVAVLVNVA